MTNVTFHIFAFTVSLLEFIGDSAALFLRGPHRVVRLVFRSLAITAEGYASQSLGVLLFYVTDFPIKYRASTFTVRLGVKCYPARKCASWDASSLFLHRCIIYKRDMHIHIYAHISLSSHVEKLFLYLTNVDPRARAL